MAILQACCMAFTFTIFAIMVLRKIAFKIGLLDRPNERKQHGGEVPLIGGVAIFLGIVAGALILNVSLMEYRAVFFVLTILVLVGILDDLHELSARVRVIGQSAAVLIALLWNKVALFNLGSLLFFGPIHMGFLALPFTVMAVVGIINAVNMTDGADGLAGSLTMQQFLLMAVLAIISGNGNSLVVLAVIISAILAFLFFNFPGVRHSRKIFMGDVGSMVLGFLLAWFAVNFSQAAASPVGAVTFLWIMAIPLFDIASVVYHRVCNRLSPFSPDRRHLHHLLEGKLCSKLATVLTITGVSFVFGVIGIVGYLLHIPEGVMFLLFILSCVGYVFLINHSALFFTDLLVEGESNA